VCNDLGRWGRGFVVPLAKRWPAARAAFLSWHAGARDGEPPFELGRVQVVPVGPEVWVANMVGQHGLTAKKGVPPIRYAAVGEALAEVARFAQAKDATVHMPRIGCGLAGGMWDRIEPLIRQTLTAAGVQTVVYDLPAGSQHRVSRPRSHKAAPRRGRNAAEGVR
jgi:hypothetical protein